METPKKGIRYQALYEILNQNSPLEDQPLLSIVLPVYNEENTIRSILESLPTHELIEVIIVNDHSNDNSVKEIEKAMPRKRMTLVNHDNNEGYGGAIISGIEHARGSIVITMDSDGQHDPRDISVLVEPILNNKADCTIGSRYLGTYHYELPIATRLGEAFVEKLIYIFFGIKISNNQSGFRAFRRETFHIFKDANYKGFTFATEIILRATLCKYKIIECPIMLKDREHGSSKIVLRVLLFNILTCLVRYFFKKINMHNSKKKL